MKRPLWSTFLWNKLKQDVPRGQKPRADNLHSVWCVWTRAATFTHLVRNTQFRAESGLNILMYLWFCCKMYPSLFLALHICTVWNKFYGTKLHTMCDYFSRAILRHFAETWLKKATEDGFFSKGLSCIVAQLIPTNKAGSWAASRTFGPHGFGAAVMTSTDSSESSTAAAQRPTVAACSLPFITTSAAPVCSAGTERLRNQKFTLWNLFIKCLVSGPPARRSRGERKVETWPPALPKETSCCVNFLFLVADARERVGGIFVIFFSLFVLF